MKMVKSLLLISAAGAVAASGAQAADLPVKAKPVEYVKVCSLYGAGFYYIPGTDICMKIGGYVRYQVNGGSGKDISFGPFNGSSGFNNRQTGNDFAERVRVTVSQDTRQQTAYGTLRTYLILGWTHDTPNNTTAPSAPGVYFNRGFIQIAGFTFGKATSFFDFASTAAVAYNAGYVHTSDTGDAGQIVGSYTAQFGNGVSGTIGVEQSRRNATVWAGPLAFSTTVRTSPSTTNLFAVAGSYSMTTGPNADNLGGLNAGTASRPDIVGNLRVDQAWGSAQVMAALHDVSTQYYGGPLGTPGITEASGHPNNRWGWAVGGGLKLNAPMIGPGDYFQAQLTYSEGAGKYAGNSGCAGSGTCDFWNGSTVGFGFMEDAVFSGSAKVPGTFNLTTAWSLFASYEHFWTPSLRTSVYGSYLDVSHNANAVAQICNAFGVSTDVQCNPDFSVWGVGSRTQWNVTKDFYVGLDVMYQKLNSASINNGQPGFLSGAGGQINTTLLPSGKPNGYYSTADQDAVSVTWRVHRDIVP